MKITLPHYQGGSLYDMPPLHWTKTPAGVFATCPNGHMAQLTRKTGGWDIDAAGNVTPSIHCLTTTGPDHDSPCGWHVFAHLDGWA